MLFNLPKATQVDSSTAGIQTQAPGSGSPDPILYAEMHQSAT